MGERSLLIDDAARVLGVSRRTVYYRIREGKLQTIRAKCGSQRVLVSSIELLRGAGGRDARGAGFTYSPRRWRLRYRPLREMPRALAAWSTCP